MSIHDIATQACMWTGGVVLVVAIITALIALLLCAAKLWLMIFDVLMEWQIPGFKALWAGRAFRRLWGQFMDWTRNRYEAGEFKGSRSDSDARAAQKAMSIWYAEAIPPYKGKNDEVEL